MRLLAPEWLWLLWAAPLLALCLWWTARRARRRVGAFVGDLAPRLVEGGGATTARGALLVAAVSVGVLALARPSWGVRYEEVHSEGLELVVVLDVSKSMLAEDAAPNRLERARIAIGGLLDRLAERGGHRIGLIAFAGVPVVRTPVTTDYDHVREQLRRTTPDAVPRGGTLIGDAIRRSLDLLDRPGEQDRVVLLLTDGEDHESFPLEAAATAAERGVAIYAIGIGDPAEGGRIPIVESDGSRSFVTFEGQDVVSRLDEATLRRMAEITGGGYVPAGTRTIPLDEIYENAIATRRTAQIGTTREKRHIDRFQWAIGLAMVLAVASRLVGRRASGEETTA